MTHYVFRFLTVSALGVLTVSQLFALEIIKNDSCKSSTPDTIKHWKTTGSGALSFNQINLSNWESGGESSASGKASAGLKASYKMKSISFESNNKLVYGLVAYGTKRIEKTEDRIDLMHSFSVKAFNNWTYSTVVSMKSQFSDGFKYPNDTVPISGFLAPGYLGTSLGFKYKYKEIVDVFISPLSGKFTIVRIQALADKGAFGVKKAVFDSLGNVIIPGKYYLAEFGFNILAAVNKALKKNIELNSNVNLYNNFFAEDPKNRLNVDVEWETSLNFTVTKRIMTVFVVHLKYDDDVEFPVYKDIDGEKIQTGTAPSVQFKETLGIVLTYKLG